MSNDNLKNCIKALEILNMSESVKVQSGKNAKQATRLTFADGTSISVSAVTTVSNFIDLLTADKTSHDNSISKSKYNSCNPKPKNEIRELQMWLDKKATYAKKDVYMYDIELLFDIIKYTIEDFGYYPEQIKMYHDLWNSEKTHGSIKANKSMLVYCDGKYTPFEPLRMTIKQWLSAHKKYRHSEKQLDRFINRYVRLHAGA